MPVILVLSHFILYVACQGMEGMQKVWVSDQTHGFVLGNITDLTSDGVLIQPVARGSKPVTADYDRVYPAEENDSKEVDDNCKLLYRIFLLSVEIKKFFVLPLSGK